MNYIILSTIILMLLNSHTAESLSKLKRLPGEKRYDQVTFLTSHNAHVNKDDGWNIKPAQEWGIKKQLDEGVRGLMIDSYPYKGKVLLCHGKGGCSKTSLLVQKGPTTKKVLGVPVPDLPSAKTLRSELKTIGKWLKAHPNEIVTLFLENKVPLDTLKKEILGIKGLKKYIFTTQDFNPKGDWPTIDWMRKNNKRLVIFVEEKSKSRKIRSNDPFFFIYDYIVENQWGSYDEKEVCKQRKESKKVKKKDRQLHLFNYFKNRGNTGTTNSYKTLKRIINKCDFDGVPKSKKPNFIALDWVNKTKDKEKDVIDLINEMNK